MHTLDVTFFYIAFWLYFAGFIFFSLYIPFRTKKIANIATALMGAGLIPQTIAIIARWATSEHVPLSNMYEYMSLMSWMAVLSLLILIWRYKRPLVGSFISPLVFMLMVTASLLPKDVSQQLVPALQSYWITIHVTLAALGSGTFVVACAVSFIYLMKVHQRKLKGSVADQAIYLWLACFTLFPLVFHLLLQIFGFHAHSSMIFNLGSPAKETLGPLMISLGMALPLGALLLTFIYNATIKKKDGTNFGSNLFALTALSLLLAGLLAGIGNTSDIFNLTERSPLRIFELFGVITVLLTPLFLLIYYLLYVAGGGLLQKLEFNLDVLDEINYKAITLGYPLYTVGALFAGAIWAEQAWGQFWSWDPKEVGSLIIWLFYSGFLHARYQRQWKGSRAAILAVFGFIMVLLSFFGNYFFGGQHAYA
jgi:ABC-type transport system involved in cytochrome c biogenesis permease subunit